MVTDQVSWDLHGGNGSPHVEVPQTDRVVSRTRAEDIRMI